MIDVRDDGDIAEVHAESWDWPRVARSRCRARP